MSRTNTANNQKALQFMHDTIYKYGITPTAVTASKMFRMSGRLGRQHLR